MYNDCGTAGIAGTIKYKGLSCENSSPRPRDVRATTTNVCEATLRLDEAGRGHPTSWVVVHSHQVMEL
ncbi:hypothetical protein C5F50_01485 [Nitrosopumilus ureiphilus]|uniref:Uncharacterized protein n=1 Tax=Nitrosopumilus ureiphilus TaxID=1470067 RepID=A0A7D5M334_9ARCH|nr:hypothetical protein C5F50_01485 [Nitrosopumilus ureiphilus]